MQKLILLIALFNIPVYAQNVIPNFQQVVLNQRSETKSTTVEDIKSFDFSTGYSLTVGGENVESSTGFVTPSGWTKVDTTVQGTGTTYVSPNLDTKPTFSIIEEGQPFMYYETTDRIIMEDGYALLKEDAGESVHTFVPIGPTFRTLNKIAFQNCYKISYYLLD